uniref:Uncharacterized protein n=1 Tax=Oryza punctata TaxID=4537 RepID=A0A0E0KP09_ORYPU
MPGGMAEINLTRLIDQVLLNGGRESHENMDGRRHRRLLPSHPLRRTAIVGAGRRHHGCCLHRSNYPAIAASSCAPAGEPCSRGWSIGRERTEPQSPSAAAGLHVRPSPPACLTVDPFCRSPNATC